MENQAQIVIGKKGDNERNTNIDVRLYLNDDFEMYDGMVFKANHTLFQVKYTKIWKLMNG